MNGIDKRNKRKVDQALELAKKLRKLLNEIQALGNTPTRYPDKCLNSYHLQNELTAFIEKAESFSHGNLNADKNLNSNNLQEELSWLIEKTEQFDYDNLSPYEFVNAAISTKFNKPVQDYLRAFIQCLYGSGFYLDKPNFCKHILTTANIVLNVDTIDLDAVYKARSLIKNTSA